MLEIKSKRFLKSGFKRNVGEPNFTTIENLMKENAFLCVFICFLLFMSHHTQVIPEFIYWQLLMQMVIFYFL